MHSETRTFWICSCGTSRKPCCSSTRQQHRHLHLWFPGWCFRHKAFGFRPLSALLALELQGFMGSRSVELRLLDSRFGFCVSWLPNLASQARVNFNFWRNSAALNPEKSAIKTPTPTPEARVPWICWFWVRGRSEPAMPGKHRPQGGAA